MPENRKTAEDHLRRREPLPTRRVALLLEYDGTGYHGIQRQTETKLTIQEKVEEAARTLGAPDVGFTVSGRTDAGVHAMGQVVALNLPERLMEGRVPRAMNALLPGDVRVRTARECGPDFHPRFDAVSRVYTYRFCAGCPVPPIYRNFVSHVIYRLDAELAVAAAGAFEGKWELREWRSSICQASRTHLTIDRVGASPPRWDDSGTNRPYWEVEVTARSFLHHQVRFMMGAIVAVGSGRLALEELQEALAEGRRPVIVKKETARGLCLSRIGFEPGKDPFAR